MRDAARALAQQLDEALGPLALERRAAILPTARLAVRTAYLLDPSRVGAFEGAFNKIRPARPTLRFLLSGPWPPYSFVTPTATGERSALGSRLHDSGREMPSDRLDARREEPPAPALTG